MITLKLGLQKSLKNKYTLDLLGTDVLHFDNKKKGLKYLSKLSKLLRDYTFALFQLEIEIYTLYRKHYLQLCSTSRIEEELEDFRQKINYLYYIRTSESIDFLNSFVRLFYCLDAVSADLLDFSKRRKIPYLKYDIYAIRKRISSLKATFIKDLYNIDNSLKHRL